MCAHASVYVCTHPCVSVCVLGSQRGLEKCGWNMVLIWLFAHPAPNNTAGPVPWCLPWAIWSDEGGGVWAWFILAGCETGSITSQKPCWVTTLLWSRGGWAVWESGVRVFGHLRVCVSVECSATLLSKENGCSDASWRGHSCTWLMHTMVHVLSELLWQAECVCLESVGKLNSNSVILLKGSLRTKCHSLKDNVFITLTNICAH